MGNNFVTVFIPDMSIKFDSVMNALKFLTMTYSYPDATNAIIYGIEHKFLIIVCNDF